MNNLQKLTALLCEVEEIKEDMLLKAYVASITSNQDDRYNNQMFSYIFGECNSKDEAIGKAIGEIRKQKENANNKILIELALEYKKDIEYHHLMMYCVQNGIIFNIENILTEKNFGYYYVFGETKILFDFTKSLHKQSEEVLGALVDYLSNIK